MEVFLKEPLHEKSANSPNLTENFFPLMREGRKNKSFDNANQEKWFETGRKRERLQKPLHDCVLSQTISISLRYRIIYLPIHSESRGNRFILKFGLLARFFRAMILN